MSQPQSPQPIIDVPSPRAYDVALRATDQIVDEGKSKMIVEKNAFCLPSPEIDHSRRFKFSESKALKTQFYGPNSYGRQPS